MGSISLERPAAVLFDRDGTLVVDDPHLRDATRIQIIDGAREALARLRFAGILLGVVTNQPRIQSGELQLCELDAINCEIERQLGPIDEWAICPHSPDLGCLCRKPLPGLIFAAARRLRRPASACLVVGDIGSDMVAAARAGATSILVPTPVTRREEIDAARAVASTLDGAVDRILAMGC